jgi:hypothetical protein
MTDTMTFQNIDLFSWDILYISIAVIFWSFLQYLLTTEAKFSRLRKYINVIGREDVIWLHLARGGSSEMTFWRR